MRNVSLIFRTVSPIAQEFWAEAKYTENEIRNQILLSNPTISNTFISENLKAFFKKRKQRSYDYYKVNHLTQYLYIFAAMTFTNNTAMSQDVHKLFP